MQVISNNKGNKIGFEVELPCINVTRNTAGGPIENGCKLMEIKDNDGQPIFWLETEGANVSQNKKIVGAYVEAISRPLRTIEEIVDYFSLVKILAKNTYNKAAAYTTLQNLYAQRNLEISQEAVGYFFNKGIGTETMQVNISMCFFAVHFSEKLIELMPPTAKADLIKARVHTENLCSKEKEINKNNSINIDKYVKSFLTLVFYQFIIYRKKRVKEVYYQVDDTRKYNGKKGELGSKECTAKQEFPMLFKVGLVDILTKVFSPNSIEILKTLMCVTDNSKSKAIQRNLILEELDSIIASCSLSSVGAGEKFVQILKHNLDKLREQAAYSEYMHNEPRFEALIEPYNDDGLDYIVVEFRAQSSEGELAKKIKELAAAIKPANSINIGAISKGLLNEFKLLFNEKY